jgi:hypothetical protein
MRRLQLPAVVMEVTVLFRPVAIGNRRVNQPLALLLQYLEISPSRFRL